MKIIWKDGYARESVADRLVAENIGYRPEGLIMVKSLREHAHEDDWYELVEDDHKLWRGIEELI